MRVQISDHQRKSGALADALILHGVEIVTKDPDILLIDWGGPVGHYPETITRAIKNGTKIILYSHCAPVTFVFDGIWHPNENVSLFLAQSAGEKVIMQAYNYPRPIDIIGWHYCQQKPFTPCMDLQEILFAPWHTRMSGYLEDDIVTANRLAFERLVNMPYQLTVRYLHTLEGSGVSYCDNVKYQEAKPELSDAIEAIDNAQLIVSNPGTFATMAIARGKPVVMYGQDVIPQDGLTPGGLKHAKTWPKYSSLLSYSWGIDDIQKATQTEDNQWRARFIGEQMSSNKLYDALEFVLSGVG